MGDKRQAENRDWQRLRCLYLLSAREEGQGANSLIFLSFNIQHSKFNIRPQAGEVMSDG